MASDFQYLDEYLRPVSFRHRDPAHPEADFAAERVATDVSTAVAAGFADAEAQRLENAMRTRAGMLEEERAGNAIANSPNSFYDAARDTVREAQDQERLDAVTP